MRFEADVVGRRWNLGAMQLSALSVSSHLNKNVEVADDCAESLPHPFHGFGTNFPR